jgi:hypothetical protein
MKRDVIYMLINKENGKSCAFRKLKEALQHYDLLVKATIRRIDYINNTNEVLHVK